MNKHFRELVKQAKLIVEECIRVATDYRSTPEDSAYYVDAAMNRIRKHFKILQCTSG